MIQFNLLPSVKKEYIKARRTKRLITTVSLVAISASIGIVVILLSIVQFGQKSHINDLSGDIEQEIATINQVQDLDKILTIQNQLNSLESLHQQKPEASRLFDYFTQLTPVDATISNIAVDFDLSTLKITGTAKDIATVNQFSDTLKFTKYVAQPLSEVSAAAGDDTTDISAPTNPDLEEFSVFSSVLTQLTRSEEDTNYILDTKFDPQVFNNTLAVTLRIPDNFVTTQSVLNRPLFEDAPETEGVGN